MNTESLQALTELLRLAGDSRLTLDHIINTGAAAIVAGEEIDTMAVIDELRSARDALTQNQAAIDTAIANAITRLSDNPSPTDVAGVVSDLQALAGQQTASQNAINAIDPDNASGGVVDDGSGGVIVEGEAPA